MRWMDRKGLGINCHFVVACVRVICVFILLLLRVNVCNKFIYPAVYRPYWIMAAAVLLFSRT